MVDALYISLLSGANQRTQGSLLKLKKVDLFCDVEQCFNPRNGHNSTGKKIRAEQFDSGMYLIMLKEHQAKLPEKM